MNKIRSDRRAEYINHALYVCPECNAIDSFEVNQNDFVCTKCNYDIHIDEYGFFQRLNGEKLYYDNIRDWYNWEGKWMVDYVSDKFDKQFKGIILEDKNSEIYHTTTKGSPDFIGNADVKLFIDRIEIDFIDKDDCLVMKLDELQSISPQINERLEIYFNNQAYRVIGSRPGVSALKWEVAVNVLWEKLGQNTKLAPYISFS